MSDNPTLLYSDRNFLKRAYRGLRKSSQSFIQYMLLERLSDGDRLTMTEIANAMIHTTAAATGLVDRMCALGWVYRDAHPTDRRVIQVQITSEGLAKLEETRRAIALELAGEAVPA